MNRRQLMMLPGAGLFLRRGQAQTPPAPAQQALPTVLPMEQYQPKSMLHVPESHVPRSRFPLIDFHTHVTHANAGGVRFSMDPANCLAVMDRKNIRTMVNLTGSYGEGLREAIGKVEHKDLIGVAYADPRGGSRFCYHTEVADLEMRLTRGSETLAEVNQPARAAFEFASDTPLPGLPPLF
jgi:hypothetical protein